MTTKSKTNWIEKSNQTGQHVNTRHLSFDLARGLAVLFMVMIHVSDFYGRPEYQASGTARFFEFLGEAPAAPVFMFLMGVLLALSPKETVASGLKRAALLFAFGYLLNFFRATLPMWIGLQTGAITQEELGEYTPLSEFLIVDILQFAGLAYGICVLLKHYLPLPASWVAISVLAGGVSPLLWSWHADTSNPVLNGVLAILWGGDEQGAAFPLFPWLVFPLLGMAYGSLFANAQDKPKFRYQSLGLGLVLIGLGVAINQIFSDFRTGDYARLEPGTLLWMSGFILVWLWVCHWLVRNVGHNPVFSLLYFWSRSVTNIYVIQWLVICWASIAVGYQTMDVRSMILSMFIVLILSDVLTRAWIRLRQKLKLKRGQRSVLVHQTKVDGAAVTEPS